MGIDAAAVRKLLDRAHREVDEGLLPAVQLALGYEGEIVASETYGAATDESRFVVFSATKAFVAGAVWTLLDDGLLDVTLPVAHYIPEFATHGKEAVTVEQVMLHTSGFPLAPLAPVPGDTSAGRRAAFAKWRLNFPPGEVFMYHATSAHWVLAELIETLTGTDYRTYLQDRVTVPSGLPRVLGDVPHRGETLVAVGEPPTPDELFAALGVRELEVGEVTTDALLSLNDPANQRVGLPGGGGVMRATELAGYYQTLLHNQAEIWSEETLHDVTSHVRNTLPDALTGVAASRSLGLVIAGSDGLSHFRGMGRTVSAGAFGHNGAGGQIAWADPATGLSFGYCTNGLDQNPIREARRTTSLSSLAAVCVS